MFRTSESWCQETPQLVPPTGRTAVTMTRVFLPKIGQTLDRGKILKPNHFNRFSCSGFISRRRVTNHASIPGQANRGFHIGDARLGGVRIFDVRVIRIFDARVKSQHDAQWRASNFVAASPKKKTFENPYWKVAAQRPSSRTAAPHVTRPVWIRPQRHAHISGAVGRIR